MASKTNQHFAIVAPMQPEVVAAAPALPKALDPWETMAEFLVELEG
jgi:hypothetical protein